jgi:hypothetical protein
MEIPNLEIQRWAIPNKESNQDSPNFILMLVNDNEGFQKKLKTGTAFGIYKMSIF